VSAPVDVLAAWDAMEDSIANRRDECLERGQTFQADLYRGMLADHREARAAVAELIALKEAAEYMLAGRPDELRAIQEHARCGVTP
jgi:hypothetical protein